MLEVMAHQDLLLVAKELAKHCAQDELERVLCNHRSPARERNRIQVADAMQQAIENNAMLKKEIAEIAAVGPKEVADLTDNGPKEVANNGPKEVVNNGPKEVANNGPKEVANNGPKEADMCTPSQQTFGPLPHWIKSARSSSGYKGVVKDKIRGGWRVKADGSTIGRYDTVPKAAEAYYQYMQLPKE